MTHDGQVLRALRQAKGLSLRQLAKLANASDSQLANIEAGRRSLTEEVARSCDRALETSILALLVATRGDDVRRRTLLAQLGVLTGAEVVRLGLVEHDEPGTDWDAVEDDYARRLVADPSPAFGATLLADLTTIQTTIAEGRPSRESLRAGAGLAQLYGLWLGNAGQLELAEGWYACAANLADRSGDLDKRTWVRGRSLSRGVYENYTLPRTLAGIEATLALSNRPTMGALEAYAALVHVHALTGDVRAGAAAVAGMRRVVEALGSGAGPQARTTFLNAFMTCRIGTLTQAQAACAQALDALADWPLWLAETKVYLGRAHVAAGDVAGGVGYALDTVRALRHDVRVIGVAVRDVLSAVPAGYGSDDLVALAGYAPAGTMPWQRL